MADENKSSETPPAGESVTPPVGTPATPPAGDGGSKPKTVEELQAELDAVRAGKTSSDNEAKNLRTRLKSLEEADEKRKTAELSDVEKAKKVSEDAEAKVKSLQSRLVDFAVQSVAAQLGAKDPNVVVKLIDRNSLELDEDGAPKNAKLLIETLLKDMPYLKADGADGVPSTNPTGGSANPQAGSEEERKKKAIENFPSLANRIPSK